MTHNGGHSIQKVVQGRAINSQNSDDLDQLCDALLPKLVQRLTQEVTLNQPVGGSSPPRLTVPPQQDK